MCCGRTGLCSCLGLSSSRRIHRGLSSKKVQILGGFGRTCRWNHRRTICPRLVEYSDTLVTFAEIGAIILLFYIGLETDMAMLRKYLLPSIMAGVLGALLPLLLGYYGSIYLRFGAGEALFMGTVLTATSIGITARMLSDLDHLKTKEGTTILGAGVVDDIVAIVLLSFTLSVLAGEFNVIDLASVLAKVASFWAIIMIVGV